MTQRGDVVLVVVQGDFGKVRPAVVVQSNLANESADSLTLCLVTSDLLPDTSVRIDVAPTVENGLKKPSQIQSDKIQTVRKAKVRAVIGRIDANIAARLDIALALHLDLYAPVKPAV